MKMLTQPNGKRHSGDFFVVVGPGFRRRLTEAMRDERLGADIEIEGCNQ